MSEEGAHFAYASGFDKMNANPNGREILLMMGPLCMMLPLLLGTAKDNVPAEWVRFEPAGGRYSIAMPAKPTVSKKAVKTESAKLEAVIAVAEGMGNSYFVVSYCDYPKKELKKDSIDKRLEQGCKAAAENAGGEIRNKEKISIDGHPGREIAIEKNGELIARMQLYLVDGRLYQLMVLGDAAFFAGNEKDVRTFLGSFRLVK
jgi:hypothetical protein